MEGNLYLENLKNFKKKFTSQISIITWEKANELFYIDEYFLKTSTIYTDDFFHQHLLQMMINSIKFFASEFEYYANLGGGSPIKQIESKSLEEMEKFESNYYLAHKLTKQAFLLYIKNKKNPQEIEKFLEENIENIEKLKETIITIEETSLSKIDEKENSINENKREEFESSMYS